MYTKVKYASPEVGELFDSWATKGGLDLTEMQMHGVFWSCERHQMGSGWKHALVFIEK